MPITETLNPSERAIFMHALLAEFLDMVGVDEDIDHAKLIGLIDAEIRPRKHGVGLNAEQIYWRAARQYVRHFRDARARQGRPGS